MQSKPRLAPALLPLAIIVFVCDLTCVPTCFAVLGDTEAELTARYGKGKAVSRADHVGYDKVLEFDSAIKGQGGIIVDVTADLIGNRCVSESYEFYSGPARQPVDIGGNGYDLAKELVQANSQGHVWKGRPGLPPPGMMLLWIRSDNPRNRAAVWNNLPYILEVVTAEADAAVERAEAGAR